MALACGIVAIHHVFALHTLLAALCVVARQVVQFIPNRTTDHRKLSRSRQTKPRTLDADARATLFRGILQCTCAIAHAHRSGRACYTGENGLKLRGIHAITALTRIQACLSIKACCVGTLRARQAVCKGLGIDVGIIGVLGAGTAGLRASDVLVRACCTMGAGRARLEHTLSPFRAW